MVAHPITKTPAESDRHKDGQGSQQPTEQSRIGNEPEDPKRVGDQDDPEREGLTQALEGGSRRAGAVQILPPRARVQRARSKKPP